MQEAVRFRTLAELSCSHLCPKRVKKVIQLRLDAINLHRTLNCTWSQLRTSLDHKIGAKLFLQVSKAHLWQWEIVKLSHSPIWKKHKAQRKVLVDFAIDVKPMHIKPQVITAVSFVILPKTWLMPTEWLPKLQGWTWGWDNKKYCKTLPNFWREGEFLKTDPTFSWNRWSAPFITLPTFRSKGADQEATEDNKYSHSSPFIFSSLFLSHWEETYCWP